MARYIVTEKVLRSHSIIADTAEQARNQVEGGMMDGGEDYEWVVTAVDLDDVQPEEDQAHSTTGMRDDIPFGETFHPRGRTQNFEPCITYTAVLQPDFEPMPTN